jgi:hypothetical protein
MPDFDPEAFVAAAERLGLFFTAVRLADGSVRLNRWRTADAVINAHRIEALWAADDEPRQSAVDGRNNRKADKDPRVPPLPSSPSSRNLSRCNTRHHVRRTPVHGAAWFLLPTVPLLLGA